MVRFHAFSIFTGSQEPTPTQKQTSMKRIFTFLFALLSACTFSAYAAIVDGTCGYNLTWTLNTKDSTLTISGTGQMYNYSSSEAPWYDYKIYIKYVTLPDGLTSIGNYAFCECSALTSITIPNSVTSIGMWAFAGCSALTSITIPNSVTIIGYKAFSSCSSLTSITIPNSVTSIDRAFSYCFSLTSVVWNVENCADFSSSYAPFYSSSQITSFTFGDSVKNIPAYLCNGMSNLTSITIPNSVTSIGDAAFSGCRGLTSVTIPNSVTSIGEGAFSSCSGLTSVTIGNSVTSIGYGAFASCNKIQEVTAYMPTPPAATTCGLNQTVCTLYVPAGYISTYSNTLWWEDFASIRAIDADYVVTFVDWDGTVLASVGVAAGEAATAPADPVRVGYTFIGWDSDFSCVIEDMTVTALYQINRYGVRFYDWNETLLKTDSVDYQSAATAPADPVREGYTFIGWDKDFSNITADLDVHAQYEAGADKEFEVIFSDQDNNELSAQSVTLRVPLAPEIEGFTFLYWKTIDARVDDVITLQAVYESNSPTEAPEVFVNPANPAQKLIRNGQVYILQYGKTYTITGQRL